MSHDSKVAHFSQRKLSKKSLKIHSVTLLQHPGKCGVIRVILGPNRFHYHYHEELSGYGRAFELQQLHRPRSCARYHVLIADEPSLTECDCLHFHSSGTCKHVEALQKLIDDDQL